jgi:hypothetical protein
MSKLQADDDAAKQVHSTASGTYEFVDSMEPRTFAKLLGAGEVSLGTALLVPIVPTAVAGLGLAAFSAGLLGLYMNTPGMRREGSIRPTSDGMALAKDSWMLGIAMTMLLDSGTWSRRRKSGKEKRAKK